MKENEKKLSELMADLNINQNEARQISRQIQQGDELLSRADARTVPVAPIPTTAILYSSMKCLP